LPTSSGQDNRISILTTGQSEKIAPNVFWQLDVAGKGDPGVASGTPSWSVQLRRYLELTAKDERHFSFEIRAEVEEFAAAKYAVEIERDNVRIDLDDNERVVTDHQFITERLRRFKDTFDALPYEDQKDALRLILKGIRIKSFDPQNDRLPSGNPCTTLEMRISLYLVPLEPVASDLIPGSYGSVGGCSAFSPRANRHSG
jgi:hypothetical protein